MILRDLLAHVSFKVMQTARRSCETILRILHGPLTWRPVLSPAGTSHQVSLQTRVPAKPCEHHCSRRFHLLFLGGLVLTAAVHEAQTSALQSWLFSRWAGRLTYKLRPGPSPLIAFPESGPLDRRLGFTRIPEFESRLEARGFQVTAQTQFSPAALDLARQGILPPYREPVRAGLVIRDAGGAPLYDGTVGHSVFRDPDEVPPLLVSTLLFIEDRRLQEASDLRQNPVVDWTRLAKAAASYIGRNLGLPLPQEGGSTLATQLEKFQHSQGGRTASPLEKLRQMTSASLRVYRDGTDTRVARREILLRYLNELPLGAAPGWGEVNGLGDGMLAWFGIPPEELRSALASYSSTPDQVRVFKHVLALLCATRAPSFYLVRDHAALEKRVAHYTTQLQVAGVIGQEFARQLGLTPISFLRQAAAAPGRLVLQGKTVSHLRAGLGQLLGESNGYDLDRLHLQADSTLDLGLQGDVALLFDQLRDRTFLTRNGLIGEHLLGGGDPRDVTYSFLLLERTPLANLVRVHTDTLDRPFDVNHGMKLELGSTAKLRTLVHYLELMAELYRVFAGSTPQGLDRPTLTAADPLTRWAAITLGKQRDLTLDGFLRKALDRTYSANPGEVFFTGGGHHAFVNYERKENGRVYSVRDGLIYSVNLVYIRLMRDIVRFHEARLPYDAQGVLANPQDPVRQRLLEDIAAAESQASLARAYGRYRGLSPREMEVRLLGRRAKDPRHLAMLFFAWRIGTGPEALGRWLEPRSGPVPLDRLLRLVKSYGSPRLTLPDYGYLLGRHPLDVWCAGELRKSPGISWTDLRAQSAEPRRLASTWLSQTRNRHAQDVRLRIRIEEDAFARMTPSWRRLGFPFERLVPSYATAIGSSSDRPDALAELMGIIQNDGVRLPTVTLRKMRFAADTPYETVLEPAPPRGERVMATTTARILRQVMVQVVTEGTARRLAGAFTDGRGAILEAGGKTGSGDNRYETFARGGGVLSSRAVSRTAAFSFFIGDRYVGVMTASVIGREAGNHHFTSTLPVALLRLLAPAIGNRLHVSPRVAANDLG